MLFGNCIDPFDRVSRWIEAHLSNPLLKGPLVEEHYYLKNDDGFLKSDNQSKANILNSQFESVYTKEDTSSLPDKGPRPRLCHLGWNSLVYDGVGSFFK